MGIVDLSSLWGHLHVTYSSGRIANRSVTERGSLKFTRQYIVVMQAVGRHWEAEAYTDQFQQLHD